MAAEQPPELGVRLTGIGKRFGDVVALDQVDLAIPSGSFFSLLGPSGCGKTTLLRILAGLEEPDGGAVLLDGRDITRTPPEKRPFNTVFQRYALFPHQSVGENVAYPLTTWRRRRTIDKGEVERRVEEALRLVALDGFAARRVTELSGGQAQRVALARALVSEPMLLLLDEPLAALDRNVRAAMRAELQRIHREVGTTFLLVTHDQDEALSLSDLVALMNHGVIEQVADPETLYRNPASLFAARFVGAGSFLEARVVGGRNGRAVVEGAGVTFAALDRGAAGAERARVLLRPEELRLVAPSEAAVVGEVVACAFYGSYYEAQLTSPVGPFRVHAPHALRCGTTVALAWAEEAGIAYPDDGVEGDEA